MIPHELPNASGIKPFHFTVLTGCLALLGVLYVAQLTANWTGLWRGDMYWSADPTEIRIDLDGYHLLVPANMLRIPAYRLAQITGSTSLSELQLETVWPSMTAPAAGSMASLSSIAPGSRLIQIDVTAETLAETMRDRLDPVYRRLARGKAASGPAGLKVLTLSSDVALDKDEIVYEPYRKDGFIVRCQQKHNGASICSREQQIAGLVVRYRFERGLLPNWGRLERRVLELIGQLVTGAGAGPVHHP